jgi:hypothetical protein
VGHPSSVAAPPTSGVSGAGGGGGGGGGAGAAEAAASGEGVGAAISSGGGGGVADAEASGAGIGAVMSSGGGGGVAVTRAAAGAASFGCLAGPKRLQRVPIIVPTAIVSTTGPGASVITVVTTSTIARPRPSMRPQRTPRIGWDFLTIADSVELVATSVIVTHPLNVIAGRALNNNPAIAPPRKTSPVIPSGLSRPSPMNST